MREFMCSGCCTVYLNKQIYVYVYERWDFWSHKHPNMPLLINFNILYSHISVSLVLVGLKVHVVLLAILMLKRIKESK